MQWTDLWIATDGMKVARRLTSTGDLHAFSGTVAIGPDPDVLPALVRPGVWVTCAPMTETVKDIDADGLVRATVHRDQLAVVGYPVVIPSTFVDESTDPADLLRRILGQAESVSRLPA